MFLELVNESYEPKLIQFSIKFRGGRFVFRAFSVSIRVSLARNSAALNPRTM